MELLVLFDRTFGGELNILREKAEYGEQTGQCPTAFDFIDDFISLHRVCILVIIDRACCRRLGRVHPHMSLHDAVETLILVKFERVPFN